MKSILFILGQFLRSGFRDKYSLFWNFAFPLILLSVLLLVFGNMYNAESTVVFQVGFVNEANETGEMSPSRIIQDTLRKISQEDTWLQLHLPSKDGESSLASELQQLEQGNRHAVIVIPEAFDSQVNQDIAAVFSPFISPQGGGEIGIYSRIGHQMSAVATDVLAQIVAEINTGMNVEIGVIDEDLMVGFEHHQVASGDQEIPFDFGGYLLAGIILMVFLSSGLELVVERLAQYRERGILRRYFATPLSPVQYGLGLLAFITVLSLIQVLLIYGFGVIVFDISIPLFAPLPLFYMVFSLVTLLSFGWLIAAVSKTANSASALANALVYPLMFLGGLYFPVMDMPFPMSLFVQGNPVTYLVNGLRDSLGVFPSPTPSLLNILVPAIWLIVSLGLGFSRFSWDMEGGK